MKLSPTKDNRTTNNFSTPCETENFDEDLNKNETNYSDFQKELQAQMKTPIQINNEKKEKTRNNAISCANSTYIFIKKAVYNKQKMVNILFIMEERKSSLIIFINVCQNL